MSIDEGLNYTANWNSTMLQAEVNIWQNLGFTIDRYGYDEQDYT